jgi:hypothetical protein
VGEVEDELTRLVVVGVRGGLRLELAMDSVNRPRRLLEAVEQRLVGQQEVRLLVVRRDAALVAPPDPRPAPVGQQLGCRFIGGPRCTSARERDLAARAGDVDELLGDGASSLGRRLADDQLVDPGQSAQGSPAASSRERSIAA